VRAAGWARRPPGISGKPHLILVSRSNRVHEPAMVAVLGEPIARPDAEFDWSRI